MSRQLINEYFNEIDRLKKFSGTTTENVIRGAFRDLLKSWARQKNLHFLDEYEFESNQKTRIRPDGTIKHDLRLDLGYWEAKDTDDDLDAEIDKKLRRGYPQTNIIFENSDRAVLIQNKDQVLTCSMTDGEALLKLLNLFFGYQRQEILDFRKAVEQFQHDLPAVLEALRGKINAAYDENEDFGTAAKTFLEHARDTINPTLTEADVREMLIQHILTEEIFTHVFNDGDFHRENNIAKQLYALEAKFFTGATKRETLKGLEAYYATIRSTAALISDHAEKQKFLKAIYEGFYKVYNPKAADRLGVVYTPNEIVKFMIEGADWLTQKHFGKALIDRDVEILDPATGTGTFICELLEHFRGQPQKLAHKYKEELHANEVAILPYYVANLNIEATYAAITGQYAEFPSLCFVDTLDNVSGLGIKRGHQHDLFAGMSEENIERVKRQNRKKISVVIGNPPYNAGQKNENDNNKNRRYPEIDRRIKETYQRLSDSHKSYSYDMYSRFIRWASDRVHDDGIVALITNRSFVDKRSFDGFRKSKQKEFSHIYAVDLGGDSRDGVEVSRGNVFDITPGVAILFFVKESGRPLQRVHYLPIRLGDKDQKLAFLGHQSFANLKWQVIVPSDAGDWLDQDDGDQTYGLSVARPKLSGRGRVKDRGFIFDDASFGYVSNRDEWVVAPSEESLRAKLTYYIQTYQKTVEQLPASLPTNWQQTLLDYSIKWTEDLRKSAEARRDLVLDSAKIRKCLYRPFVKRMHYFSTDLNWSLYRTPRYSPNKRSLNRIIYFSDRGHRAPFSILATDLYAELHLAASTDGFQSLARYRYTDTGERIDNITNWAENKFIARYGKSVTKDDIFAYVYAVLHDPIYREKYAINLKREFPRIPFYPDFRQWVAWGQKLLDLHIGYEDVEPWPLKRLDTPDEKAREAGLQPKAMLKADKDNGTIRLDSETVLSDIPPEAWDYKLGNRSGVEWVLDQYKEKTPKDPTIREKFNTYRFADYKEKVVDLIGRVTRVSVETMAITGAMKGAKRDDAPN